MDLWTAIERRHSVRSFRDSDVSATSVQKILEAAVRAPSAGNRQPWHFVVVRRKVVKEALAQAAYGQSFVAEAPVVIVVCADAERSATRYGSRGRSLYCLQDTAAATEHVLLAATALGLGSCWVGAFDEGSAACALGLPAHLRPVAMVPIGQPTSESTGRTARRPLTEVISLVD
ncbi:MAG: nitroreductase family protein [Chloroflexi bacterium]|nr:nitroreductase family protein [Chloroflexota bacterium]